MVPDLNTHLSNVYVPQQEEDECSWKLDVNGSFNVKSAYDLLQNPLSGIKEEVFSSLWSLNVWPSAMVFAWKLFYKKIATLDNLLKINVQVVGLNWLCVCG